MQTACTDEHARRWVRRYWTFGVGAGAHVPVQGLLDLTPEAAEASPEDRAAVEEALHSAYRAFNARDLDAALALMHPEVDWPNAWEGGRVAGRAAVADYWRQQFDAISSKVEPERFDHSPDGSVTVTVHQVVHDAKSGALLSDERAAHRYRIEDGLIARMDVVT